TADLVLEGGGVKGIAHLGALTELENEGYSFQRVAGTSAGAIAGALTAACMQNGRRISDVTPMLFSESTPASIDYSRVPDAVRLPVPDGMRIPVIDEPIGAVRIAASYGANPGKYLRGWIQAQLRTLGVTTFGDLKLTGDAWAHLPENQRYRLVVVATDVSRGSLVRLPWDYQDVYGLNPDEQLVADAVRASVSIPFFFEPVKLPWGDHSGNVSYLVDGGVCSDFPVEIFGRVDGVAPRWPTFGVKLAVRSEAKRLVNEVSSAATFATALLETASNGNDQVHLADPCVIDRTIFIDTSAVGAADFDLHPAQQQLLYASGQHGAEAFLRGWDWKRYQAQCGADAEQMNLARAARGERLDRALIGKRVSTTRPARAERAEAARIPEPVH
ncbi:MAG: patatin-like phospholipase family protein, partial [Candidatus Dormibacteraeota bacterium]|nr:patatin-like phospholipase family protein [Candidatus Dormibacteraeota bacterium]